MPSATVSYIGFVRSLTGVRTEEVEIASGTTVREVVGLLSGKYGDTFDHYVLSGDMGLAATARMLVGGVEVTDLPQGYETVVADGCELVVMTVAPLSGG